MTAPAQNVRTEVLGNRVTAQENAAPPPEKIKRWPMVGWYDPRQLAKTGIEVAVSTIFGRHSDHRLVEAMAFGDADKKFYDYSYHYTDDGKEVCKLDESRPRKSIWIDYVGDVGDGWNSTYAVAYHLAESGRTFNYKDQDSNRTHRAETKRGDLLVFGGDEVYPTASRKMYEERLVAPYRTALQHSGAQPPHVFAVPGNHDWYDSLVAFTRLFTARPWFAGWRTRQSRSYFALKLPHNWWLLGTDVQLGSDIDAPQMRYFESLVADMDESKNNGLPASIILCHAEPHWIRAAQYGGFDPNYNESNLKLLEKRLGKNVAVFIAGDLHHYRRHESEDKLTQKITAGGGGAFLHPTHAGLLGRKLDHIKEKGLEGEKQERNFHLKGCFPSTSESSWQCWRNLIFPYLKGNESWTFGFATAALYVLMTLSVVSRIDDAALRTLRYRFGSISGMAIESILGSPVTMFFAALTIVAFMFFTDTHSRLYRWIMGGLHAVAHILAAFTIALISVSFVADLAARTSGWWRLTLPWPGGFNFHLDTRIMLALLLIALGGFLIGPFIMGAYLLFSMNFFGRHSNEAFSSLAIEDWKNFLRLHINESGDLTIYPVGIRRVPRKWKPRTDKAAGPALVSDDPDATAPELIELPIVLKKSKTVTGVETSSANLKIEAASQTSSPA
ncbi:MAG TPA: metallophosphoesterase [Pyrinomonadaceae bacterium]|nr:metallophosphoesterase [Pyrinomonadaceae bacterium]